MASQTIRIPKAFELPQEILCIIIEFTDDQETLRSWARTCQFFYPFATRQLWRSLSVSYIQMETYANQITSSDWSLSTRHRLFPTPIPYLRQTVTLNAPSNRDISIIRFLVQDGHRASEAPNMNKDGTGRGFPYIDGKLVALPGTHVQELELDLREISDFIEQLPIETTLPLLLSQLPNAKYCAVEGAIYDLHLRELSRLQSLISLNMRRTDQYYRRAYFVDPEQGYLAPTEWTELVVNFGYLEPMTSLRSLEIGRLVEGEGVSLARAIRGLQLSHLDVSASGFAQPMDDEDENEYEGRSALEGTETSPSPLVTFIKEVSRGFSDDDQGSFPPSLKTLVLRDRYHTNVPIEKSLLGSVIERSDLEGFAVVFPRFTPIADLRFYLKLNRLYIIKTDDGKHVFQVKTETGISCECQRDLPCKVLHCSSLPL